jgi:hypothetical protein
MMGNSILPATGSTVTDMFIRCQSCKVEYKIIVEQYGIKYPPDYGNKYCDMCTRDQKINEILK